MNTQQKQRLLFQFEGMSIEELVESGEVELK